MAPPCGSRSRSALMRTLRLAALALSSCRRRVAARNSSGSCIGARRRRVTNSDEVEVNTLLWRAAAGRKEEGCSPT